MFALQDGSTAAPDENKHYERCGHRGNRQPSDRGDDRSCGGPCPSTHRRVTAYHGAQATEKDGMHKIYCATWM
ncbi:hypothetical protein GN956_G12992 [Arapaima gigas]